MNLDEVVAANVRRLREQKGWSVADLAERVGVRRQVAYDFERARPGQTQRAFKWSEIVRLCEVFHATLFDLVLPPWGARLPGLDGIELTTEIHPGWKLSPGNPPVAVLVDYRKQLSRTLFGLELDVHKLKDLDAMKRKQDEILDPLLDKALERIVTTMMEEE